MHFLKHLLFFSFFFSFLFCLFFISALPFYPLFLAGLRILFHPFTLILPPTRLLAPLFYIFLRVSSTQRIKEPPFIINSSKRVPVNPSVRPSLAPFIIHTVEGSR
ncbi:hypothetical protein BC940DRAFT_306295 [Gongronella butleri]|nr:hypothetical protein BC940DRAFT_306295 [Gongronella butleri]